MQFYVYRTTAEKVRESSASITESGDTVVSAHHVVGRDWVLLCHQGRPESATVAAMSAGVLGKVIADAVEVGVSRGLRAHDRRTASRGAGV